MTNQKKGRSKMIYLFGLCIVLAIGLGLYIQLGSKLSNMQEGMWEIKMEINMPRAPMSTSVKWSQNLTKDDYVPQITIPEYECRIQRRKYPSHILGNHLFWRVQCEGFGTLQGAAHIKYSGDTIRGKIQMRTIGDEEGQKRFNAYISGWRTGACES
jgi:hypothetical protein